MTISFKRPTVVRAPDSGRAAAVASRLSSSGWPAALLAASLLAGLLSLAPNARANVYATNIKINGSLRNAVTAAQGSPVTISYILNENATAGITVNILSGTNVVRSLAFASGNGTTKGLNSVVWDGTATGGGSAPLGAYGVSVTAAATGYTNWTQISDDNAPSSYSHRPRGIAVDKNTSSPYYGRVFIANSTAGPTATNANPTIGDVQGIIKCNADGSYADEGGFGRAGYDWVDDGGDSPIQLKVESDDKVYFDDWTGPGKVVACDPLVTTNTVVFDTVNYSANPYSGSVQWINFEVTNPGTTNGEVFVTDANYPSAGVWMWRLDTNGVTDINDPNYFSGYQVIATGGDLPLRCDGIAIDANTNLYVIENRANAGDPNMRAGMFTNWDGQTPLTTGAAWVVGGGDDSFRDLYGMALDSVIQPKYLACSMYGAGGSGGTTNAGGIRILNAADGSTVVSNLTQDVFYRSVSWDNVGNLYAGSQTLSRWRVFSPPGANQATTMALATIQLAQGLRISDISIQGGNVSIEFTGATDDTASAFTLQSASSVQGPYAAVSGATITAGLTAGGFHAVAPASGNAAFYRIMK